MNKKFEYLTKNSEVRGFDFQLYQFTKLKKREEISDFFFEIKNWNFVIKRIVTVV